MLGPSSPCTMAVVSLPQLAESEGSTQQGSPAGWDVAPPSSQGSCYVELPLFLPSHAAQGGCLTPQLAP